MKKLISAILICCFSFFSFAQEIIETSAESLDTEISTESTSLSEKELSEPEAPAAETTESTEAVAEKESEAELPENTEIAENGKIDESTPKDIIENSPAETPVTITAITEETSAKIEATLEALAEENPFAEDSLEQADQELAESDFVAEEEEGIPYIELGLPGVDRPEVEKFRQQYLQPKWTAILVSSLEKGIDYRLYIRKSLENTELPKELEYLPVVESNYKTDAKSKSGALGLWQFMENSVKPFLALNDYVDERLDPWKSTDAAMKKLADNYKMFEDWELAIAAYNCGAGAMKRALAKAEEKDFWYLVDHNLLPSQTANYVPKLLAIADLALNAEYYGIEIPSHQEEYESLYNEANAIFDYVSVNKAFYLKQLAQEMRIDYRELSRLNPSFVLGFTHPSVASQIRLPLGTGESAVEALSKMEPIDFPIKYKVEAGDSLWSISRKYHCTVSQICELNGIKENAILKIGKILYIPSK
ncbi:MAG: transglycosylase SLT domain-containing protein [Treponema sp.]|nr:transglycosylase SLT domain-containing protein [Treponema sp.]